MVERVKAGRLNLEFSDEPQLLDQIFVTGRQINLAPKTQKAAIPWSSKIC
jgi:hypothetical protein